MRFSIIDGERAKQGTQAWLDYRKTGLGASDAPAVMGTSKWMTPEELFRQKLGIDPPPEVTFPMRRGKWMEPPARKRYEAMTGNLVVPLVLESLEFPFLRTSLDGITLDGQIALEIKAPGREAHMIAKAGLVPPWYVDQLQQILMITGARELHYFSFDGEDGVKVIVFPDLQRQAEILRVSKSFWDRVQRREWATEVNAVYPLLLSKKVVKPEQGRLLFI